MRSALLFLLLVFTLPAFSQDDGIVQKKGKFGYKENGHWILRPRYDSIREFSDGYAAVMKKGKWGYVDASGDKIIPLRYSDVTDFQGGLAAVKISPGYGWSIINKDGVLDPTGYDTIVQTDSMLFGAHEIAFGRKFGFDAYIYPGNPIYSGIENIEKRNGKVLLTWKYETFGNQRNTVRIVTKNGNAITPEIVPIDSLLQKTVIITSDAEHYQALLTKEGIISAWYSFIDPLDERFYLIDSSDRSGVINSTFQTVIPAKYVKIYPAGNRFVLKGDSSLSLADTAGKILFEGLASITDLGNGCFSVKYSLMDTTYALINENGEKMPQHYAFIYPAKEGITRVISNDYIHYSYVDANGKQIAPWYDRGMIRKDREYYVPPSNSNDDGNEVMDGTPAGLRIAIAFSTFFLSEILPLIGDGDTQGHYTYVRGEEPGDDNSKLQPYEKFPGYSGGYFYFYGTDFQNGHAVVSKRNTSYKTERKYPLEESVYIGAIDSNGTEVLPPVYTNVVRADTCFIVQSGSLHGIADGHGKMILRPQFSTIQYLGENCFSVRLNSISPPKLALFHTSNHIGLYYGNFIYSEIKPFHDGKAKVKSLKGVEYTIDRFGKRVY